MTLGGCQGACPLIGAGVGRGGSRARRRLRSSGAQRISRSLALSPLSFFFVASLRDDLARLERTTIRLLSQRHLVFVVNSGWVCSARLFICSRKESGWIETVIRLLLSRRGCRFECPLKRFARLVRSSLPILSSRYLFCVSSVAPSNAWPDWSRDLSPPLSALHLFTFRKTFKRFARLVRSSLPILS